MATVRRLSSLAALRILIAISPRLATRIFLNLLTLAVILHAGLLLDKKKFGGMARKVRAAKIEIIEGKRNSLGDKSPKIVGKSTALGYMSSVEVK